MCCTEPIGYGYVIDGRSILAAVDAAGSFAEHRRVAAGSHVIKRPIGHDMFRS